MATAELSKFAVILSAALSQHHLLGFEKLSQNSIISTNLVSSNASLGLPDFIFQDVCLWVSDYSIVVIQVIKTFYGSSVYSCYLFLIYSASVRSIPFLSFSILIFT